MKLSHKSHPTIELFLQIARDKSLLESWGTTFLPGKPYYKSMNKKFEINQTKIKGGCQSGRKVVTHDSKSNLPLT